MIMASCDLHDVINLKKDSGIELETNSGKIPSDESNIMVKAAKKFFDYTQITGGVKMSVEKNIPVAAGLAGGSADAAAVIIGLNLIYHAGLSPDELCDIGLRVGADVPYCIKRGTALASGIGEVLSPIGEIGGVPIVIVKPQEGLSTAEIYEAIDGEKALLKPDTELLCRYIKNGDIKNMAKNMRNVMQQVSERKIPEIGVIVQKLKEFGAMGAVMSGSGPSVFALFENEKMAESAASAFGDECFVYCGKTI